MNARAYTVALVGLTVLTAMAGGVRAANLTNGNHPDASLLASAGEFELGNGDAKVIANRSVAARYRICVKQNSLSVPVKVTADGVDKTVATGQCDTVSGKHIRIAPAMRLAQDAVLIGKYEHLKS
jgi:hypothetical protein